MRFKFLLLFLLTSCRYQQEALSEFVLDFNARCDDEPVAEVVVSLNGRSSGVTDSQGQLQVMVTGREGQVLPLRVECPERYRAADAAQTVRLVTINSLTDQGSPTGMVVPIQCLPADRNTAVVVRAPDAPNVAVLLYGQEVARTDNGGVAHLQVRFPPNSRFALELDTRQYPQLRPQNPTKSFTVSDREEVFLFEQFFAVEEEPSPVKRRRRRRHQIRFRPEKQISPSRLPTRL